LVTKKIVENVAVKLLELAATELPQDVKEALQKAYSKEESKVGKAQLVS
jgi:tartrate dehydratase alpha subunit/fumarate hydratase class I-like protein